MTLTILTAVVLALLGLIGLFRGVLRGLIALAGTLLGAVLVDLWQERWADWLRSSVERTAWPSFLLTAAIFLLVALLVGYGGSLILPRAMLKAQSIGLFDRLLGAFVGALNGALIVSYLLRYAQEIWAEGEATALITASPVTQILDAFLPWFILAMVATTALFVVLRATLRIGRAMATRPAATAAPAGTAAAGAAAKSSSTAASSSVAGSKNLTEADQKLNNKIDNALKK